MRKNIYNSSKQLLSTWEEVSDKDKCIELYEDVVLHYYNGFIKVHALLFGEEFISYYKIEHEHFMWKEMLTTIEAMI